VAHPWSPAQIVAVDPVGRLADFSLLPKADVILVTHAGPDHLDPATITSEGNFRRVWEIHDLNSKGADGERSVLASVEYDCAERRMRTLKATGRSLPMARGEIIPLIRFSDEWFVLQRGKDDEIFFKILDTVCAR